jgi:hypothetical protein
VVEEATTGVIVSLSEKKMCAAAEVPPNVAPPASLSLTPRATWGGRWVDGGATDVECLRRPGWWSRRRVLGFRVLGGRDSNGCPI